MTIEEHFDPVSPIVKRKTAEQHDADRLRAGPALRNRVRRYLERCGPFRASAPRRAQVPGRARKRPDALSGGVWTRPDRLAARHHVQIVRAEMLYFLPQMRTKIMNEGFASFWHEKILESLDLTSEEHWEFRRLHSSVLSPSGSRMGINPYYVGFQILKDIERRWDGIVQPGDDAETDWMGRAIARPAGMKDVPNCSPCARKTTT